MDINKLNEGLSKFLETTVVPDENKLEDAKEIVLDYNIDDLVSEYDLTPIAEGLAEDLDCKVYSDGGRHYLVKNVKGMPDIDEKSAGLDFTKESHCKAVNVAIELFAERMSKDYGEDFVVLGRSGGYWGLYNPEGHIKVSDRGYRELADMLLEEYKEKGYLEEDSIGEYFYYNYKEFGERLQEDIENFEFDKEYEERMKSLIKDIKDEEREMNSKEYWETFELD